MAPRAKYDQVTNDCSPSKPVQFTGRKSSHRSALETRSDGLDKLRLAGRGKKRLLVSELSNLFAVPLSRSCNTRRSPGLLYLPELLPLHQPLQTRPDVLRRRTRGATVFGLPRVRRVVRMVNMLGECAAVNYIYPIGFYIQPYRTL